jgi:hypothetical protein
MGNIHFSSLRQMLFNNTSRKDDLVSLVYLLLSLLNGFIIPSELDIQINIFEETDISVKDQFLQLM